MAMSCGVFAVPVAVPPALPFKMVAAETRDSGSDVRSQTAGALPVQEPAPRSLPLPCQALLGRFDAYPQQQGWKSFLPPRLSQTALRFGPLVASGGVSQFGTDALGCRLGDCGGESGSEDTSCRSDSDVSAPCIASIRGRVWALARAPQGCRLVQDVLEGATSELERAQVATELRGHVAKAMRCPHANHVLTKCIAVSRPETVSFIIDELTQRAGLLTQACRHRYGCRVVQELLKRCPVDMMKTMVSQILDDTLTFAIHPFGNYVMQHLAEYATPEQRQRLLLELQRSADSVCRSPRGSTVVASALKFSTPQERASFALTVVEDAALLSSFAQTRPGSASIALLLEVLNGDGRSQTVHQLLNDRTLRGSKHGSTVVELLASLHPSI